MQITPAKNLSNLLDQYEHCHPLSTDELIQIRDGCQYLGEFFHTQKNTPFAIYYLNYAENIEKIIAARKEK